MIWHVLITEPRREFLALDALEGLGADVLLPVEYRWHDVRRSGGRTGKRQKPEKEVRTHALFPRYIAVGFDRWPDWNVIAALKSVPTPKRPVALPVISDILRHPGTCEPLMVGATDVLRFRHLSDADGPRVAPIRRYNVQVGDRVRIVDGPFAGHTVKVTNIKKNSEAIAGLAQLFGTEVSVTLDLMSIEAAA